jgi:ankyrin repeat protein
MLLNNSGGYSTSDAIDFAARNGHLRVVEMLHENGATATSLAVDLAVVNGHHEVVEFLLVNRSEGFSCRAIEVAREKGDARMIDLLS